MRARFIQGLGLVLTGVCAAWAEGAAPAAPLEEVVISASLRGVPAERLPASVSVLDRHTLETAGVQHFEDVLTLVPNLNWSAGTSRPRYFQLRGIGELDQFQGAPNASVGFLIDDIDFSGVGMPATLFDVDAIEVLRGPQGTAYGANALAGLISVRTRDPQPVPELKAEATGGDYGTYGGGVVAGGALGGADSAAFRLVAQNYTSNGFRRNAFLNRHDTNGYDETTVRGKVRWNASDDLRVDLTAMFVDLNNGYDAWSIDNSRITQSNDPGRDAERSKAAAARLEYAGFQRFTLRSTTTYADSNIVNSFDGDWGNDPFWGVNAPYDWFSRTLRNRRTWSEDLRLISTPGGALGGRASWVAGLYVVHAREANDQFDLFNGGVFDSLTSLYQSTNYAGYGEVDFGLTERTRLSVGTRVEHRHADYHDTNELAFSPSETMVGGHVSLEHTLADQRNLYVTLSRGYKAGGFNIGTNVPDLRRQFSAEYLWNLESGIKSRSTDGRIAVQADVFYMRRTNQQVATSVQTDPSNPLTYVFFTDNAARGENYGLESTVTWNATERLRLTGNLGLLQTRFLGYDVGGRNLDGRAQAHAPSYQAAISAEYRHPSGLLARVDVSSIDSFYYDTSNDQKASPFTLTNLKIGYERQRWAAYAWARNVFNENYAMRGFYFQDEPPDFPYKRYVQHGDPRQVGITVNVSFK
jgi:outer membrane receptor protein involved in Fe transport